MVQIDESSTTPDVSTLIDAYDWEITATESGGICVEITGVE